MDYFWEYYQERRIRDANEAATSAKSEAREQSYEIDQLDRQVSRLSTAVVALAELLQEHQGISTEVIEAKMREVEGREVSISPQAKRCLKCNRVSSPERTACMYCGKPLPSEPFLPTAASENGG